MLLFYGIAAGSISFSRDKENIVIFLIDAAQGCFMKRILEENPYLQDKYEGFVYYPNSVSTSNFTYASYPSIMSGADFSVGNMNLDDSKTITEKVTESTEIFYSKIKEKGYSFTSTRMKYSNIDDTKFDSYLPLWDPKWTDLMGFDKQTEIWYTRLWENALFSCVPIFLKPKVYNNKNWVVKNNSDLNSSELSRYHFVKLLPKISNCDNESASFMYIHSMFTHTPWHFIDEDGNVVHDVSPYESNVWFAKEFVAWIDWMKDNEVYDNTKIILVSDHGPSYYHYKGEINVHAPIVGTDFKGMSLSAYYRLNNLLMVKDFNKKGKVSEDWRLMTNADTYAIAFDDNDPTKGEPKPRKVKIYYTKWHQDLRTRMEYENIHAF